MKLKLFTDEIVQKRPVTKLDYSLYCIYRMCVSPIPLLYFLEVVRQHILGVVDNVIRFLLET